MGTYDPPVDGILGLAFPSLSTFPADPLFQTLVSENKVSDAVFSFQLSSSGGELFIGGTNEALYQKDTLAYADVTKRVS
jgi:cathepsin D